ncbi:hypothetical protein VQ044_19830 [Aurantimonas sp. C2-5-R2]|uniref:hypothetical protein n=1 Tax=Aurantimonas sp. C2-5-R2 TaxID=3113713 RepID=UPI002F9550B3
MSAAIIRFPMTESGRGQLRSYARATTQEIRSRPGWDLHEIDWDEEAAEADRMVEEALAAQAAPRVGGDK